MELLFDVYDAAGGASVGDSASTLNYDTERYLASGASNSSGEIAIEMSKSIITPPDVHRIVLFMSTSTDISSGTSRSQSMSWIEIDTGSGFEELPGTYSYMYNRNEGAGKDSAAVCSSFDVSKKLGSPVKIRVRVRRVTGGSSLVTVAGGSRLVGFLF